jgi:hypothetical protein
VAGKSESCPLAQEQVINHYFFEHRAKLIDIAAYLDRIDRAQKSLEPDFRHQSFLTALSVLLSKEPNRTKRILELLSDSSANIPQSAEGMKGAKGAVPLSESRKP